MATYGWQQVSEALQVRANLFAKAAGNDGSVVVDSHTEGEPTRVVIAGGPTLAGDPASRGRSLVARHDGWRRAVVDEPRGAGTMVGALLGEPTHPEAIAQVLYFNNVGLLRMCVHATIGVVETLARRAGLPPGDHALETAAGLIVVRRDDDGRVSVENVESRRVHAGVDIQVPGLGTVRGDVAWGGNWFFLAHDPEDRVALDQVERLIAIGWAMRRALAAAGITGEAGAEIDHVHLRGTARSEGAVARAFVLCPGGAYDRSPCGTGTSALLACLAAEGSLPPGASAQVESVIGSSFTGRYQPSGRGIRPTVSGRAHLTGEGVLLFEPADPYREGIS